MAEEIEIFLTETLETDEGEMVLKLVPMAVGVVGVAELAGTQVPFLVAGSGVVEIISEQGGHDMILGGASVHLNDGGERGDGSWFSNEDERAGDLTDLRASIGRRCYAGEGDAAVMLVSSSRNVYVGSVTKGRKAGDIFDPRLGI